MTSTRPTDFITITGARENNLKNIAVRIPKRQITVFTGVSGSGKSSLVFDTIAAEAQRQLNETFTAFVRGFLPNYGHPDLDAIENISAAIIIDQKRIGGNSRSTVGTITDINPLLRLLYSRVGQPRVGPASTFSFNEPPGMCPECDGIGRATQLMMERFIDKTKSLNEGAFQHPDFHVGKMYWKFYTGSGFFDNDKPLVEYSDEEMHQLLYGEGKIPGNLAGADFSMSYEGIVTKFNRLYVQKDINAMSDRNREIFLTFVTNGVCPRCRGKRLNELARSSKIDGYDITDLWALEVKELIEVVRSFSNPIAVPICTQLIERLDNLITIGLGYLSLDRETSTLSGGESQRIKMVRHLNSSLTEMMYILDEPSVGLHARDVQRLNTLLRKLRDKGNTVLVVEHDRDVIEIADHVIDMGPRAGRHGGEVVYAGSVAALELADTLTGTHMKHRLPLKTKVRKPRGTMTVPNANLHNLKNVTVEIPAGVLTVITGVAGSGKSTLINDIFVPLHPDAVVIDQGAVGVSRRSNTATYTGILDEIRKLFAKATGESASLFSFNSKGACPNCNGLGVIYTDLAFMEGIKSPCEVCEGKRFTAEVLELKLRGKSISDVFAMTTEAALAFFPERKIKTVVQALDDVGLGYLQLGQPLDTLSGGECQRLKLATELHKKSSIYVMDEPTTGLHMSDVGHLLHLIDRLVDQGNSVIVIEHDLDVIKNADWIIDLGPDAGSAGGEVVFAGSPAQLLTAEGSITAEYVRRDLGD
ncbi:MAG: excinuclease ABC subunit UvrA [Caldilineaceae bacterium]|nr:excinuclease ABC subunit UvrA [Caldilineaceae bacterium]